MELRSLLPLVRERWQTIVAVALAAMVVGLLLTLHQTPEYTAHTTLYVSARTDTTDASKLYQGDQLSQEKVKSYTVVIRDVKVMQAVIDRLGLKTTPEALADQVSADTILNTVLLNVTATDTVPGRAAQIANAVADEFIRLVPTLENAPAGRSPVHVSVVSPARLPTSPVSPRPMRNLGLAAGLGLLAGFGLAAVRHTLDTTVKTAEQTEEAAGAPLLGVVPFHPSAGKNPTMVASDPMGPGVEAYRHILTSMQFLEVDGAAKILVVTSCLPEEGKSTTACNLALSLAEAGRRVLLIDGDLRRPRASRYLGLPSGAGLTSVLVGRASLDEVTQAWGEGSLSVLASGPVPPNPSRLLGSQHMQEIVEELRLRYDTVLIDAPPVLPVADALVIGALSDGALLVVRHGKTRRDQLTKTASALRRAEVDVLGTVLNMAPRRRRDTTYHYDYSSTPMEPTSAPPVVAAQLTAAGHDDPAGTGRMAARR